LKKEIRPDTVFASVMAANNESARFSRWPNSARCVVRGNHFPHGRRAVVRQRAFETINQFHADLVSVCAHKFHGPKGGGIALHQVAAASRSDFVWRRHENERRAGTENLPAIMAWLKRWKNL